MANDRADQQLHPGDIVVYVTRGRLSFGIITKANPHKSTIKSTNSEFEFTSNSNYAGTPIDNRKIYKLNV